VERHGAVPPEFAEDGQAGRSSRESRERLRADLDLLLELSEIHEAREAALAGAVEAYPGFGPPDETIGPVLEDLAVITARLNRLAGTTTRALSPSVRPRYEMLVRLGRLPFVAHVREGRCTECHVALSDLLAGSVLSGVELHGCPSCNRLLCGDDQAPTFAK
jgi:hypothetical protein